MKPITLLIPIILSTLFISCDKFSKGSLSTAKTSQEAIMAISGVEYKLVESLYGNGKKMKIKKPVHLKLIDKGLAKQNDMEITMLGKLGTMGLVTNLEGWENKDENLPYVYRLKYYNENSANSFQSPEKMSGKVIFTIKGDSVFLVHNRYAYKFIKIKS